MSGPWSGLSPATAVTVLIDLLCYYFTKWRIFYWIAVVMIIGDLAILAFVIGMYIPLISSII